MRRWWRRWKLWRQYRMRESLLYYDVYPTKRRRRFQ